MNMVVYTLEQCWEILTAIDLQKMPILEKKVIFSDETHFDVGGKQAKLSHFEAQKTRTPAHPKRLAVFCG